MGPLLFVLYASDLESHIKSRKAFYADDTKIFADPLLNGQDLQSDLDSIFKWCSDWMLPLNRDKCVVLHLGKNNPRLSYSIDGHLLDTVESYSDLGVTITENLSWSEHISNVTKKANSKLYLLSKTFTKISFSGSIRLYKTYVRPLLEYCGTVWCPELVRDRTLLENIQKKATRLSFKRRRPDYQQRLSLAGLPTFEARRLRGDLIITFRILKYGYGDLQHLFILDDHSRLRGHSLKVKKEPFSSIKRQHFLCNRIFSIWNSLPTEIINSPSINVFKNQLDSYLFVN